MDIYVTLPSKTSHIDTFHEILILHTCKEHSFPFKWHQNYANLPTGSKVIDKSVWIVQRVPFWEIWLRKFVWHTTVLQQLQFKIPETVMKHHIWPLKVVFEQKNARSTRLWWKPKINTFDLQIENRRTLHCDRVSMQLISCVRVTNIHSEQAGELFWDSLCCFSTWLSVNSAWIMYIGNEGSP